MKSRRKFTSALIGILSAALILGACSDDKVAVNGNVSERTVVIGGLYDITGGTGDVGTPYAEGEQAYFKYLASKGGVEGISLELTGKDYAYEIPEAQKIYQELRDKEKVSAVLGWGTGDTEALRQQVANDKLPFFSASYSESLKNLDESPYNFLAAASYSDQGRSVLKWIKENHKGSNPTLALLYNDTAFGRSPIEDIKAYAAEIGIEVVDEQIVDVRATEAQSQLLNMEKKNPDYAIIQETWGATATILRDAKTLGIDTQFIGLNWASGEGVISIVGEDVAEGYIGILSHAMPYEDLPGMAEIKEYLEAEGKTIDDINQKFIQGWTTAKILVAGIEEAAKKHPDGELTGEEIRSGLESLQDLDLGGLGAPVSFSADNHTGTEQTRLGIVKDGKWEPLTDYFSHKD
ncbi:MULTISPECIES: ABC transporter substrate-binding protein [unclassified Bacillus (in: firmicutes)]|jgi:branched-chain amino acid transport system substrate-binding protein|uniref:ABC transporter substrate-binding protein n=1 Tax=Bacillaceae TaxID=186817 RepID=UPI0006AE4F84|nr:MULTISPECIES: ABC transporter substrate-binding protein [unclassified Bacillus (in: firmicutes)]ALC86862.1 ABC transporter substrate-binding protein [Bacillus sp. FJAT-22090]MDF2067775.1 ABC transporter substrate-binding protein [Bacillus sp. Cr_A10]